MVAGFLLEPTPRRENVMFFTMSVGDRYIRRTLAPATGGSRQRPPRHPLRQSRAVEVTATGPPGLPRGRIGLQVVQHKLRRVPSDLSWRSLQRCGPAMSASASVSGGWRHSQPPQGCQHNSGVCCPPKERGAPCLKSMPRYELTTSWSRSLRGAAKGGAVGCAERSARVGCQAQCQPPWPPSPVLISRCWKIRTHVASRRRSLENTVTYPGARGCAAPGEACQISSPAHPTHPRARARAG